MIWLPSAIISSGVYPSNSVTRRLTDVRHQRQLVGPDMGGGFKRSTRHSPRGANHELCLVRQPHACARPPLANFLRLIEARPYADDHGGVEADKPRVAVVVRRPRF